MRVKEMYCLALMASVTALLVVTIPFRPTATMSDESIESSAKSSYVFKSFLKEDNVTVKSMDGDVTLTGTVGDADHKSLAQETVANLPGVKSVDNRLQVKGEIAIENSDASISTKVKTTLFFHRNVSGMTDVNTRDGIVTLHGDATSQAQKDLTTELIKDIEGVKDVQNEMKVIGSSVNSNEKTMGQKMSDVRDSIDDASVTALVKMTLLYHRSTSTLDTKVMATQGQVTLKGKAGNAIEKNLATKYVQNVHGVYSVVNFMTIGEPTNIKKPTSKKKIEGY